MNKIKPNGKRDRIIVELLYSAYPTPKSAEWFCTEYGILRRKAKSIKNARAMGQILRRFRLVNTLSVVQSVNGFNSICRYQTLYRLREIDFRNIEKHKGIPVDEIMKDLIPKLQS